MLTRPEHRLLIVWGRFFSKKFVLEIQKYNYKKKFNLSRGSANIAQFVLKTFLMIMTVHNMPIDNLN